MIAATMMLGRNAWTWAMNSLSAGILSAPMAAETANRKTNQKATAPIRFAGEAPGLTRSTYWPASLLCRARSRPTFCRILAIAVLATLAMM
jgi:hypothetical protein